MGMEGYIKFSAIIMSFREDEKKMGAPLRHERKLGVPLAFVKAQARVGSPSGLGLRPRTATALWPTGPGPGGIPL